MLLSFFSDGKIVNLRAILTALIATIITVGAGIWITKFTGPVPISVTQTLTEKQGTFNASGDAKIGAVPDQAELRLGIDVKKTTVVAAQEEVNQVINSIVNALEKMRVETKDIQTQNYQVNPEYDYRSSDRRITGYRVSTQLAIKTTNFEQLNQIIDTATRLGTNQVGGINFSLSETKQEELRKQAREEAIAEAKDNANELARISGVKLGKVINVTESEGGTTPYPFYARTEMAVADTGPEEPTQIEPGTETYTYSVTLSYETL